MSTRSNARASKRVVYTAHGYIGIMRSNKGWHPKPQRNDKKANPRGTPTAKMFRSYRSNYS